MIDDIALLLRSMYLEGVPEFLATVKVRHMDITNSLVEGLVEPITLEIWRYAVQTHDWHPMILVPKKDKHMLGYLIRVYKATLPYWSSLKDIQ